MNKAVTTLRKLRMEIIRSQKRIGKERDRLRDLISDAQQIEDDASEAIDLLEIAADKLSELQ